VEPILFITNKYYPDNNPQAILLRNIIENLKLEKKIKIHLFSTTKKIQTKNIIFNNFNLDINFYWRIINFFPLFSKYNFVRQKYKKQIFLLKNYIKKNKIKLIISYSNPYILNIICTIVSKDLNIKNIVHYSDPFYKTIYKKYIFFNKSLFDKKIEKFILNNASHVVVNNVSLAYFIFKNQKNFFFNKTTIIPHSYCAKDFKRPIIKNSNKSIKIRYFGALNKIRSPIKLINIFIKLKKIKFISKNVEIHFHSNLDKFLKKIYLSNKKYFLKNKIYFHNSLLHVNSIKKMYTSSLLLSMDAEGTENIYLTTKLIHYLNIRKPVLNITQINSPNYKLGKTANFFFLNVNNQKHLETNLTYYLCNYSNFKPNEYIIKKYESKNVSKLWKNLIFKILKL
jgi:hypothetical protein